MKNAIGSSFAGSVADSFGDSFGDSFAGSAGSAGDVGDPDGTERFLCRVAGVECRVDGALPVSLRPALARAVAGETGAGVRADARAGAGSDARAGAGSDARAVAGSAGVRTGAGDAVARAGDSAAGVRSDTGLRASAGIARAGSVRAGAGDAGGSRARAGAGAGSVAGLHADDARAGAGSGSRAGAGGGFRPGVARAGDAVARAGVGSRASAGSAGGVSADARADGADDAFTDMDDASADARADADVQSLSWQRRFEPYLIPEWSGVDRTPVRATVGKTMFASIMRGLAADRNASGGTVRARIETARAECLRRTMLGGLPRKRILAVFGVCIEYENRAYLFSGRSFNDMAMLESYALQWRRYLGDAVRIIGDGWLAIGTDKHGRERFVTVQPTPWNRREGWSRNVTVPLNAWCFVTPAAGDDWGMTRDGGGGAGVAGGVMSGGVAGGTGGTAMSGSGSGGAVGGGAGGRGDGGDAAMSGVAGGRGAGGMMSGITGGTVGGTAGGAMSGIGGAAGRVMGGAAGDAVGGVMSEIAGSAVAGGTAMSGLAGGARGAMSGIAGAAGRSGGVGTGAAMSAIAWAVKHDACEVHHVDPAIVTDRALRNAFMPHDRIGAIAALDMLDRILLLAPTYVMSLAWGRADGHNAGDARAFAGGIAGEGGAFGGRTGVFAGEVGAFAGAGSATGAFAGGVAGAFAGESAGESATRIGFETLTGLRYADRKALFAPPLAPDINPWQTPEGE